MTATPPRPRRVPMTDAMGEARASGATAMLQYSGLKARRPSGTVPLEKQLIYSFDPPEVPM